MIPRLSYNAIQSAIVKHEIDELKVKTFDEKTLIETATGTDECLQLVDDMERNLDGECVFVGRKAGTKGAYFKWRTGTNRPQTPEPYGMDAAPCSIAEYVEMRIKLDRLENGAGSTQTEKVIGLLTSIMDRQAAAPVQGGVPGADPGADPGNVLDSETIAKISAFRAKYPDVYNTTLAQMETMLND